jgi:hypothetical protein
VEGASSDEPHDAHMENTTANSPDPGTLMPCMVTRHSARAAATRRAARRARPSAPRWRARLYGKPPGFLHLQEAAERQARVATRSLDVVPRLTPGYSAASN